MTFARLPRMLLLSLFTLLALACFCGGEEQEAVHAEARPEPVPKSPQRYQATGGSTTDFQAVLMDFEFMDAGAEDMGGSVNVLSPSASGQLANSGKSTWGPDKLVDRNPRSGWVEGDEGDGIGSWIGFLWVGPKSIEAHYTKMGFYPLMEWSEFHKQAQPCTRLQIVNGFMSSEDLWRKNSRVKSFKLMVEDEHWGWIDLQDAWGIQDVDIPGIPDGGKVNLVIEEVYSGTKWKDTVISELYVYCREGWPRGG